MQAWEAPPPHLPPRGGGRGGGGGRRRGGTGRRGPQAAHDAGMVIEDTPGQQQVPDHGDDGENVGGDADGGSSEDAPVEEPRNLRSSQQS